MGSGAYGPSLVQGQSPWPSCASTLAHRAPEISPNSREISPILVKPNDGRELAGAASLVTRYNDPMPATRIAF